MVETIAECVRGCKVAANDESTVFVAAVARNGLLCQACLGRIGWLLDDAADVAARARLAVVPGLGASTDGSERVSGSRDPGLPLNVAAMEACDLLVSIVGGWAAYWARVLGIAAPRALAGAVSADMPVAGVRAGTSPESVADGLQEWGWWIKRALPDIVQFEAAGLFHDDLRSAVEKVERMFPRGEVRQFGQMHARYCPVCEMQRVWVTWVGRDPVVRCGSCQWVFETEWGEFLGALGIGDRG